MSLETVLFVIERMETLSDRDVIALTPHVLVTPCGHFVKLVCIYGVQLEFLLLLVAMLFAYMVYNS